MEDHYDIVVIGAGHNGLVAANYLARTGCKVGVFETRDVVGGACVTEELIPGAKWSSCAFVQGLFRDEIVQELQLREHGLEMYAPDVQGFALFDDGSHLFLWKELDRTLREIEKHSRRGRRALHRIGARYRRFGEIMKPFMFDAPPLRSEIFAAFETAGEEDLLDEFRARLDQRPARPLLRIGPRQRLSDLLRHGFGLGRSVDAGTVVRLRTPRIGRVRRPAQPLGIRQGRHGRHHSGARRGCAYAWRHHPHRCAGRPGPDQVWTGARYRPRERRGDRGRYRDLECRTQTIAAEVRRSQSPRRDVPDSRRRHRPARRHEPCAPSRRRIAALCRAAGRASGTPASRAPDVGRIGRETSRAHGRLNARGASPTTSRSSRSRSPSPIPHWRPRGSTR